MASLRDLARCERSRMRRRDALLTLLGGLALSSLGFQIRAERQEMRERYRRSRHYAGRHPRRSV